jgi:hypothetical protein
MRSCLGRFRISTLLLIVLLAGLLFGFTENQLRWRASRVAAPNLSMRGQIILTHAAEFTAISLVGSALWERWKRGRRGTMAGRGKGEP